MNEAVRLHSLDAADAKLLAPRPASASQPPLNLGLGRVPTRWLIFVTAALIAAVVVILAALIWNGANVLSRAWDDVRRVRESDKLLVLLESEASRLQNLINRVSRARRC
jgi:hypothetical protein